jgi:tetratricopeptide (TPR) repeat protein
MGNAEFLLVVEGDSTRSEAARKHLTQFLSKANTEDSVAALYSLVRLESNAKNVAKANEYADLILALDPKDVDSYRTKASVLTEAGETAKTQPYVVIISAMTKGKPVDNWDAHFAAAKYDAASDIGQLVKKNGNPEEARTYDSTGGKMDAVFYWTKGEGYAFYSGKQMGAVSFRPQAKK